MSKAGKTMAEMAFIETWSTTVVNDAKLVGRAKHEQNVQKKIRNGINFNNLTVVNHIQS